MISAKRGCIQGHPTIAFYKISFRKQILSTIFYYLRTTKISGCPFHSCTIFEAYLVIPFDFLKFNFHNSLPKLGFFSQKKRKPKIFGLKNLMEIGIRKCLAFRNTPFSEKYQSSPCNFENIEFPQDDLPFQQRWKLGVF